MPVYNDVQIGALQHAFKKSNLTIKRWIAGNNPKLTSDVAKKALSKVSPIPDNKYNVPKALWSKFKTNEAKAVYNYVVENSIKNQANLHFSAILIDQGNWEVLCHNIACYAAWGIDKIKK